MADENLENPAASSAESTTQSELPLSPPSPAAVLEETTEASTAPEGETEAQKKTREGWDAKRAEAHEKAAAARREADAERAKRELLERQNAQLLDALARQGKPADAAAAPDELETIRKQDAELRKQELEAIKGADFEKQAEIRGQRETLSERKEALKDARHAQELQETRAKTENLDVETRRRLTWEAKVKDAGVKIEDASVAKDAAWEYARSRGHKPGSTEERAAAETHYDLAFDILKKSLKKKTPASSSQASTAHAAPGNAPGNNVVQVAPGAGTEGTLEQKQANQSLVDTILGYARIRRP